MQREELNGDNLMKNLKTSDFPFYNHITNLKIIDSVSEKVPTYWCPVAFMDGSKMESGVSSAYTIYYRDQYILD